MKISKNQWIVIGIVGAVAIWYFFLRKKDTKESGYATICAKPCDCLGSPKPGGGYEQTCACCGGGSTENVIKRNATTTNESGFANPICPNGACKCLGDGSGADFGSSCQCCAGYGVRKRRTTNESGYGKELCTCGDGTQWDCWSGCQDCCAGHSHPSVRKRRTNVTA